MKDIMMGVMNIQNDTMNVLDIVSSEIMPETTISIMNIHDGMNMPTSNTPLNPVSITVIPPKNSLLPGEIKSWYPSRISETSAGTNIHGAQSVMNTINVPIDVIASQLRLVCIFILENGEHVHPLPAWAEDELGE